MDILGKTYNIYAREMRAWLKRHSEDHPHPYIEEVQQELKEMKGKIGQRVDFSNSYFFKFKANNKKYKSAFCLTSGGWLDDDIFHNHSPTITIKVIACERDGTLSGFSIKEQSKELLNEFDQLEAAAIELLLSDNSHRPKEEINNLNFIYEWENSVFNPSTSVFNVSMRSVLVPVVYAVGYDYLDKVNPIQESPVFLDIRRRIIRKNYDSSYKEFLKYAVNDKDAEVTLHNWPGYKQDDFKLYNHLQNHNNNPSARSDVQERKQRDRNAFELISKGALIKPPYFITNNNIWSKVHSTDISFYRALSEEFEVKESTIKRIYQECKWEYEQRHFIKRAEILDQINPDLWPYDQDNFDNFNRVVKAAKATHLHLAKADNPAIDILKTWMKNNKLPRLEGNRYPWKALIKIVLRREIETEIEKEGEANEGFREKLERNSEFFRERAMDEIITRAEVQYVNNLCAVKDVLKDVANKLLIPQILLSLERQGYNTKNVNIISEIVKQVSIKLWDTMLYSEQLSASAYWHSPRVAFQDRIASVSLDEKYSQWHPVIPGKSVELANGIQAHTLTTSRELQKEGKAMRHCVWSYAANCFESAYHILSLRDKNGERLSTLNLKDSFNRAGERQVVQVQHKSFHNDSPPREAQEAASELVELINTGDIRPDWSAIDEIRSEYKIKAIEFAAGYDFRNSEMVQKVLDVYMPCLPRKVFSGKPKTNATLIEFLNIDSAVKDFITAENHSKQNILDSKNNVPANGQQEVQPIRLEMR